MPGSQLSIRLRHLRHLPRLPFGMKAQKVSQGEKWMLGAPEASCHPCGGSGHMQRAAAVTRWQMEMWSLSLGLHIALQGT